MRMIRNSSPKVSVKGAYHHNLKGADLDIFPGELVVFTGLSGTGKSTLLFDVLHAEGQRKYVETFSPYVRQFLETCQRPEVDSIENARPSISVEQKNTIRNSRSTVGTMTEICEYFKAWFPLVAKLSDPESGKSIKFETAESLASSVLSKFGSQDVVIGFSAERPSNIETNEFLRFLMQSGQTRAMIGNSFSRIESLIDEEWQGRKLFITADRIRVRKSDKSRIVEAITAALANGHGFAQVRNLKGEVIENLYSGLRSPVNGRKFNTPTPSSFSFNSPLGACSGCRGFGRVIEIDGNLVVPDDSLSLEEGAIRAFSGKVYGHYKEELLEACGKVGVSTKRPWKSLSKSDRDFVWKGDSDYIEGNGKWFGIRSFFKWLETKSYKMHVRVFLSKYRGYFECPSCKGSRFKEESLFWKWDSLNLSEIYALPVDDLHRRVSKVRLSGNPKLDLPLENILSRLQYLMDVGLGYLSLNRTARSLSGGETQRVNLTACLGASLTETLFALDEPTIGLHGKDVGKLIRILRALADEGNFVCVVEHDEQVIKAADRIIELGPLPGSKGGQIIFKGSVPQLLKSKISATGKWLASGFEIMEAEDARPSKNPRSHPCLHLKKVSMHNVKNLSAKLPLQKFVCISGVSGSGKSTLLNDLVYKELRSPGNSAKVISNFSFSEVVMIDQSSVVRSPRSNAILYSDAWGPVKEAFSRTDDAKRMGYTSSDFSFNSGNGRCESCSGLGYQVVEMQFLSDLQIPCGECEGKRFNSEILEIRLNGLSISQVLDLTVEEAAVFFKQLPKTARKLNALEKVGLGYLTLGQPLNTLSGGESQRLKLVKYLSDVRKGHTPSILLIDEPTTGLHMQDVERLIRCLRDVVLAGHSLFVIEHNLQVIRASDWIVEMGPGAGNMGGKLIAQGTPSSFRKKSTPTSKILFQSELQNPPSTGSSSKKRKGKRSNLRVVGARENNLRNVSVEIPPNKFVVVTGPSGSGKSSLAFDVIFAEGQRRFVESMSSYARQFVEQLSKPDVDAVTGISPAVAIEQRVNRGTRKSTVGSVTEVAQFLRLLYAKVGTQLSIVDQAPLTTSTEKSIAKEILAKALESTPSSAQPILLLSPLVTNRKGHHKPIVNWARDKGFEKIRCDGDLVDTDGFRGLDRYRLHNIEVLIESWKEVPGKKVLNEAIKKAFSFGKERLLLITPSGEELWYSTSRVDSASGETYPELEPALLSWNSPKGWCPICRGYGKIYEKMKDRLPASGKWWSIADGDTCSECEGTRLNPIARNVILFGAGGTRMSLPQILELTPIEAARFLRSISVKKESRPIVEAILPEILERLSFMRRVGLDYLALNRETSSLSGGESQRIRLAGQLGSNLSGVLYVLDEPSIGLHPKDNQRLLDSLRDLQARGNSLVVVEHDQETILQADYLIDVGPEAGRRGGDIIDAGSPAKVMKNKISATATHLREVMKHPLKGEWRKLPRKDTVKWLRLTNVKFRNLKNIDAQIPLARLTVCCGVSGSGKSSLIRGVLLEGVKASMTNGKKTITEHSYILRNGNVFGKSIEVTQDPIGKTSRSTPGTYLGVWNRIRDLIASLPEAKRKGFGPSDFSFNVKGGRCEVCKGAGKVKVEMNFLPTSYVPCEQCGGRRYRDEILELVWKGKNIADMLEFTFTEAAEFFSFDYYLKETFSLMVEAGLGYLRLGQISPTLSGGEAQRLKLASELARGIDKGKHGRGATAKPNLYILEEPTIGLHPSDTLKLISMLHRLVDEGNTVVVIEHDVDVISEADYLIELGPGGGAKGGSLIYQGSARKILDNGKSNTRAFLKGIAKEIDSKEGS